MPARCGFHKIKDRKEDEFVKRNVEEILAQMTLKEKAALCSGQDFWHITGVPRLGIAPAMVSDGPHGLRKQDEAADHLGVNDSIKAVCFPAGCATACSFDQDLIYNLGKTLGKECRAEHVSILLGPAMNIKRSPLCGRNFEYYSEDPYLAGKMASSFIQGVQSEGVGTSPKHFAANNQEYRRMSSSSNLSERTLREIYLAGFETAVKEAAPWSIMCSYNRINGVYASENPKLLTDILRKEWGFDGFVMSDWGAVNEKIKEVKAGLELEMPGPCEDSVQQVMEAVKNGTLGEETLNEAVRRILKILLKETPDAQDVVFDREQDHALAAHMEAECAVLLKNNGVLPLARDSRIVYIGEFAQKPRYQGGGSSHINATRVTSAAEIAPAQTTYVKGFEVEQDAPVQQEIEKAVKAHPDTKWRIVVMHQDIYGSGLDHSDSDGTILRTQLTPIFDANDIDVVLQGHDHSYARTYQLTSDGQPHDNFTEYTQGQNGDNHDKFDDLFDNNSVFRAYYKSQNLCYNIADKSQGTLVNPEGVFYLTANSATGSKFYNLIPQQQDYIAARNQNWRPSYSVINITADKFSVTTYDVETGAPIDETYTIIKK